MHAIGTCVTAAAAAASSTIVSSSSRSIMMMRSIRSIHSTAIASSLSSSSSFSSSPFPVAASSPSSSSPLFRTFTRSIATVRPTAPSSSSSSSSPVKRSGGGISSKSSNAKSSRSSSDSDAVEAKPSGAPARAEKTPEQKKAARLVKKQKKANEAAAVLADATIERKAKSQAQKVASSRGAKASQSEVIEKEVPLMDLTGLTPGQNKFSNVLKVLVDRKFPDEVVNDLTLIGDFATANTREILSGKLANLRELYGRKPYDTGSPEVQVAMLTERLKGYDRHMLTHATDIASRRGFLSQWHRRRKLLKYLRKTKYETYAYMMQQLGLRESDIDKIGLSRTSGTQVARIKSD